MRVPELDDIEKEILMGKVVEPEIRGAKKMSVNEDKNIGNTVVDRKTGRSLDALVAAIIEPRPPLAHCRSLHDTVSPLAAWVHTHIFDHGDKCEIEPRCFSSDIGLAMRVVEKMREHGHQVVMRSWEGAVPWSVKFISYTSKDEFEEDGDSLPEAICRAALYAMECFSISDRGTDGQAS